MFFLGSAYPLGKFGLNASMNPIFFGALRMGFVFLCLLPFCKIIIPKKKYLLPLIGFSLCMGAGVNMFLYLSINAVTLLAPITIGAQLSIPFAILISSFFLKEKYLRRKSIESNKLFSKKSLSYGNLRYKLNNIKLHDRLILGGSTGVWGGMVNTSTLPNYFLKILENNHYKELGAKALEFSKNFNWSKIVKRYIELI